MDSPLASLKPTAEGMNRKTYEDAAILREEMSRPGGRPGKVDYSIMPTCFSCDASLSELLGRKSSVCSACRSVLYCSKACQTRDWKTGRGGAHGHKVLCERNKRHMLKVPEVKAILKLFPWGKIESDGTFAEPLIRAYFGVLGAEGRGYWNESGGSAPHAASSNAIGIHENPLRVDRIANYQDGSQLLLDQHLDDKAGWMLEDRLIPKLNFEPGCEPQIASSANVVDWKSWYEWRSLPFDSPAALLMHYPLTVYYLLVNVLGVASPSNGSPGHRQTLDVHYVGPEVELNMLPLFSELALLLPYTDIKLTFFGYAVRALVQKAGKRSIAAKAKQNEPVYTYTAPPSMGQSTLAIYFHGENDIWHPRFISRMNLKTPDAIVAPNAGLSSYTTWMDVVIFCHVEEVPFGATEYAEQSAEVHKENLPKMIRHAIPNLVSHLDRARLEELMKPRDYPIEFNPFQRPGQRGMSGFRLPSVSNGFTIRVFGKDSAKGKKAASVSI